jgi:uncharacterized protein (TIGR02145 family)
MMNKLFTVCLLTFFLFFNATAQNVGIGTTNPHPSAELDVSSIQRGFLPPRMTFAQRAAIVNPAAGLMVWCTDCGSGNGELSFFDGVGWKSTGVGGASILATPPQAPTNLVVTVSYPLFIASLSWTDLSSNEIGYKIERKTESGVFTQIGQVASNVILFKDSSIVQGTTYTYRVIAYNNAGNSVQYSNEFQISILATPTVSTSIISSITNISATGGGIITATGGASVTARGICWSTSQNPTTSLTTKTTNGTGTGSFTSFLTGLTPNTTYYVRAYATNSVGTAYGAQQIFTTTLPSVTIGTQIWSSQNLNVRTYRNGDLIPHVTDPAQWINLTTGAWCWYNNDSANYSQYGRLYNWYAVTDPRGLAPQGWHVPTNAEWNRLIKSIDPSADTLSCCSNRAAPAMKSTTGWPGGYNGTNSSGFTGLPGGLRQGSGSGSSGNARSYSYWWSESSFDDTYAWDRLLNLDPDRVQSQYLDKRSGLSVRVVKD